MWWEDFYGTLVKQKMIPFAFNLCMLPDLYTVHKHLMF